MNAIVSDLREIILHRFKTASLKELLELTPQVIPQAALRIADRFEIVDDEIAIDHKTGLTWLRDYVPGGSRNWSASLEAASACNMRGWKWRAPTIEERLSINDYERHDPAFNAEVFKGAPAWEWTSTVDNSAPRGRAWGVDSNFGNSVRLNQSYVGFVRAVRVGQF